MSQKIIEYFTIVVTDKELTVSTAKLDVEVVGFFCEGLQPFGGPIIYRDEDNNFSCVQAMVRYEN